MSTLDGQIRFEMETEVTAVIPVKITVLAYSKEEAIAKAQRGEFSFFTKDIIPDISKTDFSLLKTFNWDRKGMKLINSSYAPDRGWLHFYQDSQGLEHTINDCPGANITDFILDKQFKEKPCPLPPR